MNTTDWRAVTESHFVVKCHTCGTVYLVPRRRGLGQEKFLAQGPRCINTTGTIPNNGRGASYGVVRSGQVCGAPLGRGMFARNRDFQEVPPEELLGYVVVRPGDITPIEKIVERPVERLIDTEETAALRAELDRLRTKYETPCPLLVRHYDEDENFHMVPCGGFLGHAGNCAEVW